MLVLLKDTWQCATLLLVEFWEPEYFWVSFQEEQAFILTLKFIFCILCVYFNLVRQKNWQGLQKARALYRQYREPVGIPKIA